MTNLTGKTPADTYGDLLTVTNNGQGQRWTPKFGQGAKL